MRVTVTCFLLVTWTLRKLRSSESIMSFDGGTWTVPMSRLLDPRLPGENSAWWRARTWSGAKSSKHHQNLPLREARWQSPLRSMCPLVAPSSSHQICSILSSSGSFACRPICKCLSATKKKQERIHEAVMAACLSPHKVVYNGPVPFSSFSDSQSFPMSYDR